VTRNKSQAPIFDETPALARKDGAEPSWELMDRKLDDWHKNFESPRPDPGAILKAWLQQDGYKKKCRPSAIRKLKGAAAVNRRTLALRSAIRNRAIFPIRLRFHSLPAN